MMLAQHKLYIHSHTPCSLCLMSEASNAMPIFALEAYSVVANDDRSSFTACQWPLYHGLFYTSSPSILNWVWLANPLRDFYLRPLPRFYLPVLKIASPHSSLRIIQIPYAPRKSLIACVKSITSLALRLARGFFAALFLLVHQARIQPRTGSQHTTSAQM